MGKYGKIRAVVRWLREMGISVHASFGCYFIMLAIFPALTLVLGLLRYTALKAADLMELVSGLLPDALEPHVWVLISETYAHTSKTVISLSAVILLWSASRGVYGLMMGLNRAYGIEEHRGWFRTRVLCMGYTVLFVLVLILTLVLHVFGNTLYAWLELAGEPVVLRWCRGLGFFLPMVAQILLFCGIFMYLPGENNGFRESLPGALFASLGWAAFSWGFSVYMERFADRTDIYGSVYAVALAMLWLYMCLSILFYGGALNCFLKEKGNIL